MGRAVDAGAAPGPRAVHAAAAAQGDPTRRVPARDHGDCGPDAHAQGRRRPARAVRVQSAVDAGRDRRRAGQRVRDPRLRPQRRRQRPLLPAHRGGARHAPAAHDGRRRRPHLPTPRRAQEPGRGRDRRHGGDDHGRHPAALDGAPGRAGVPGDRGERRGHQAPVRQPLRHRPVHDRRHPARDEPAPRGTHSGGRGLRHVWPRRGGARQGDGGARHRHRGRADARARGRNGRLPSDADGPGGGGGRRVRDGHGEHVGHVERSLRPAEGRRDPRERGALQRRDRSGDAPGDVARQARGPPLRGGVHAAERPADLRAR